MISNIQINVKKPNGKPAPAEIIEICYEAYQRFDMSAPKRCKNFTSELDGSVQFVIPAQPNFIQGIYVEAVATKYPNVDSRGKRVLYQPMESLYLTPWYSPSGSFLEILPIHRISECQDKLKLDVIYTTDTIEQAPVMFVQMIRRGIPMKPVKVDQLHIQQLNQNSKMLKNIIMDEQITLSDSLAKNISTKIPTLPYIAHTSIELEINGQLTPISRIVVFFVRNDREVVADSTYFFTECLTNKVKLSIQKNKHIGAKFSFDLEADQNSLCNVHVLDKASKKDSSTLTKEKLFDVLRYQDIGRYNYPFQNGHCKTTTGDSAPTSGDMLTRSHRSSLYADSLVAFDDAGFLVMADLTLETKPCISSNKFSYLIGKRNSYYNGHKSAMESLNTRFFKTLLWDLVQVNGKTEIQHNVPKETTKWSANAICLSDISGIGISELVSAEVHKPFYLGLTTPYSIVSGESVELKSFVYNYLPDCLPLTLALTSEYSEQLKAQGKTTQSICVCGNESKTVNFKVKGQTPGKAIVSVKASSNKDKSQCDKTPVSDKHFEDIVSRNIQIETNVESFAIDKPVPSFNVKISGVDTGLGQCEKRHLKLCLR
ncbi:ovostatin-like [Limulus polyphemus]|uniref:Ovostatin-like n=1 Tax=Limulus polyphemus TaxID=6850 RepID=A0ABM1T1T2_LIMPO|nr:ovostatin-like [Limulus polyphemus]